MRGSAIKERAGRCYSEVTLDRDVHTAHAWTSRIDITEIELDWHASPPTLHFSDSVGPILAFTLIPGFASEHNADHLSRGVRDV